MPYEDWRDEKVKPNMASATTFIYWPNENLPVGENLEILFENIKGLIGNNHNFVIKLELDSTELDKQEVKEMTKLISKTGKLVNNLRKSKFVPIAIDARGKTVYQRKEDIDDENSDT